MKTDLRKKKQKMILLNKKLINNVFFGKTMENLRKHRYIKLVTTKTKTNYLVSEPNYDTTRKYSQKIYWQYK